MSKRRREKSPAPVLEDPEFSAETTLRLISKCHDAKGTSADVTRLYKTRDFLAAQNWDSEGSTGLKVSLVSCFEQRLFYRSTQGINFLSFVFTLHPSLVQPVHAKLKKVILTFPPSFVGGCSQVLFKAWSTSTGGQRLLIEQTVTEWMKKALFCSVKTSERVRFLLTEFHTATRTAVIDELLSKFYGPILFRHTKVANWEVRFNSIALLAAAFPVMPPDRTAIEFEEKLTFQFRVFKEAMEDPNESVRKCAIVGIGRILRDFWELLTIEQIAMVLDTMVEKCGRDKKSFKVRGCVVESIGVILDNPLTHGVMTELLPSSKIFFNDDHPSVRLKYAQFLANKLAKLKTFSIPSIVPHGSLLARLVFEHTMYLATSATVNRDIAKAIASIIAPSLFVSSIDDQVSRCERMADSIPQGLLALVAHSGRCVTEVDRVRLAVALFTKIISSDVFEAKVPTVRILLRTVATLLRSTQFASVQGTEDKFDQDAEKLCAFIYKHVSDRGMVGYAKKIERQNGVLCDMIEVLSTMDGTRLPYCYAWIHAMDNDKELGERVMSVWDPTRTRVLKSLRQSL
jgi:hypothetical protein